MSKITQFFDTILSFFVLFAVGFMLGARFTKRAIPSVLFGVILAFSLSPLYCKITKKEKVDPQKEQVRTHLILMGETTLLSVVCDSLSFRGAKITENFIEVDGGKIFCSFTKAPLSIDKMVNICENAKSGKIIILTNSFDNDCTCANEVCGVKVSLWNFDKVYDFLKKNNALPTITPSQKQSKLKNFLALILRRENAKGYFKSALVILALSGFVGISIFYIVFASLSFILGVTVLVLPRKKT